MNHINRKHILRTVKMTCKYCGHALSNNSQICPNCGRLMDKDQLKLKKEINGYNNPYMQRLNKLNANMEYKLNKNNDTKSKGIVYIIMALLIIIILAIIIYINNR